MQVTDEQIREHTSHLRMVVKVSGGSWCGSPRRRVVQSNRTLCGADMTAFDLPERDFRYLLRDRRWVARACARCVALLNARTSRSEGR